MTLIMKKKKSRKPKIRWWKLKESSCQEAFFRPEMTRTLGGKDGLPDEWTKQQYAKKTAKTVLGVTFGKRKRDRETWWWNEEVQENIRKKRGEESMGQNKKSKY